MLGSAVLELAIGLVFVFLFVSLICSAIGDKISEWLEWRAAFLEKGIRELVLRGDWQSNQAFVEKTMHDLYIHPAIQGLYREPGGFTSLLHKMPVTKSMLKSLNPYMSGQQWTPPNWIPEKTFVLALLNVLAPLSSEAQKIDGFRKAIEQAPLLKDTQLQKTLLTLSHLETNVGEARGNIEKWFDSSMDQVTELYKRRMYFVAFVIGIIVSVMLNVDTIAVVNHLWREPSLRASIAVAAQKYAPTQSISSTLTISPTLPISTIQQELETLNLPIGWRGCSDCSGNVFVVIPQEWTSPFKSPSDYVVAVLLKIAGWVITGFAAAQGAPFWFDLLNKLTQRQ